MRRILICVLLVFILWNTPSSGYQDDLYRNYSMKTSYSLYDLVHNPAFLRTDNHEDIMNYVFYAGQQVNGYKRTFDPERIESGGIEVFSYKALDDKSALASRIIYETSRQNNLYRSLEKDFYTSYFAYTDTTTGDVTYAGPRLNVIYYREIRSGFKTGLQIDYGIERGLKDVYTKCETISRNININWGLAYSNSGGTSLGATIRYFDRQSTYEAVKEITDAVVNTYMGYNFYFAEQPRSTNEKKIYTEGVELDAQFSKCGFLLPSLKIDIAGGYGSKENRIMTGSSSIPTQRGYWVREGGFINTIISLNQGRPGFGLVLTTGLKRYYDWASPQDYKVKNIENDVSDVQYGVKTIIPLHSMVVTVGYEQGAENVNYREYTFDYVFNKQLSRNLIYMDISVPMNQVMQMHYGAWFSKFEPWFYWNTNSIQTQGIEMGVERLFVFGSLGADLQLEFHKPAEGMGSINRLGVVFSFQK